MGETSFPYAGGGGVTDARYEVLMAEVTGSGRIAYNPSSETMSQPLVYGNSTGRQVGVHSNMAALVRGFRWETDGAGLMEPVEANTSGQPRIDLAVLRLTRSDYKVRFAIVRGVPSSSPSPPAATQDTGSTGVWELPIALIRVTSDTAAGLPTISGNDVTPLDNFIAQSPRTGHSGRRPPAAWGALWTEYDTGRSYIGRGGSWHLIGENGPYTRLAASNAWNSATLHMYAQRRNGWVEFGALLLTYQGAAQAAGADIFICDLPPEFRPVTDHIVLAYIGGADMARCYITASTGRILMQNYSVVLARGNSISIPPTTWIPAN